MHEVEYNLSLLNPMLPKYSHDKIDQVLNTMKGNRNRFRNEGRELLNKFFPGIQKSSSVVIIHPGMTGHSLNWSARNYARLGQLILENIPKLLLFSAILQVTMNI